ncbi:MAG TPA: Hsp20/alpha crystallin family protein [Candidatus Acidoferrales bacterium]|nr:Hsp20/alpha crystallin family protein [Candidatus Acidoferrales bacterium]
MDLYETPEAFILEADLPGSKGRCRGRDRKQRTRAPRKEIFGTGLQRRQISLHGAFSGDFARRMKLPVSVDKEQIQTEFHGGVLRVILPKIGKRT